MGGQQNQFDDLNDITNIVTLAISSIAVGLFILKYSFAGLDTPALIILSSYLIKNAFCIIVSEELYSIMDYITPITSTIVFAVLLYFVLEMSYIRAAIEEESLACYQSQKQYIKKVKIIMFFLLLGVYFPANMIQFAQMYEGVIYMSIVIVRSISKFIVDMYMFPLFLYHLMFFTFRKQLEIYKRTNGLQSSYTLKHKIIIAIVIMNWFLKFVHALANIFIVLLRRYSLLY